MIGLHVIECAAGAERCQESAKQGFGPWGARGLFGKNRLLKPERSGINLQVPFTD